jgi:DNA-binding PadR family transcriptional regulator
VINKKIRLSLQTIKVLRALLDNNGAARYGFELAKLVGMRTGVLYPTLRRLEEEGWVISELEPIDPAVAGRPARVYYTLTSEGDQKARCVLTELSDALRPPPPNVTKGDSCADDGT